MKKAALKAVFFCRLHPFYRAHLKRRFLFCHLSRNGQESARENKMKAVAGVFVAAALAVPGVTVAADGQTLYAQQCAACHGPAGEGLQFVAPGLKGSAFVKDSSIDDIVNVIRQGRSAEAKKYPAYPSVMPPFPQLKDEDAKAVAEYVKTALQK